MLTIPTLYALAFPAIDPVLLRLGPINIRWYSLAYIAGIVMGLYYGAFLLKRRPLWSHNEPPFTSEKLHDFIPWAVLGIILGGRLGAVLLWDNGFYFARPLEILAIWKGGMAFHGGLIGLVLASLLFCRKNKLPFLNLGDILAAAAPFGIGLVRIANFINGELWGRVSYVPWAVYFPGAGPLPRHPSQLYEAVLEGFIIFFLLLIFIHKYKMLKYKGRISGYFLIFYAMARIIGEQFREPDPAPLWFAPFASSYFTYGVLLSLPLLIIGSFLLFYSYYLPGGKNNP